MSAMNFFLPISKIEKQDDGSRLVSGYASTPTKDLDGEIVALDAIKSALPGYMEWRAIRQMHQPIAVGTAKEANVDDKGLYLTAKIVDPNCVRLIDEQVLNGFSIGGKKLAKKGDTITEIELIEVSVVDRPANPDCRIEIMKSAKLVDDSGIELVKIATEVDDEPIEIKPSVFRKILSALGFGKTDLEKREFSDKEREHAADTGAAMPDGSFPIENKEDLRNAIQAHGRAKDPEKAKAHIIARAKNLGAEDELPDDWKPGAKKAAAIVELRKFLGKEALDAQGALTALQIICQVIEAEKLEELKGEDEEAQVAALMAAIEQLKAFIASEIMEEGRQPQKHASAMSELKDYVKMTDNTSDLAKRFNKGALSKAAHHIAKAADCHKAACSHMEKCAGSMMAHVKAQKAADGSSEHLTTAMDHMAKANGAMEEMADHHELAQHYCTKAAGGDDIGGEMGPANLSSAGGGGDISLDPTQPMKAAGFMKEVMDTVTEAVRKAAFAEGQLEAIKNMPAGPKKAVIYPVNKTMFGGAPETEPDKAELLMKGINMNATESQDIAQNATTMLRNMFANPGTFAKNTASPEFRADALVKGAN